MTLQTLSDCQVLDQQDPLRSLRDLFQLPEGVKKNAFEIFREITTTCR